MKKKEKRKQNIQREEAPVILSEWLYLSAGEPALRRLYEYLRKEKGQDAQLWEEAGVLEIGLSEGRSADLEVLDREDWDEELLAFAKGEQADQVYTMTFPETARAEVRILMGDLVREAGGVFCKDAEHFLPRIKGR